MLSNSSNEQGGSAQPQARSAAAGALAASSRLVIRDERKQETLASSESGLAFPQDYESETFKLEPRGRKGVIVAHPVAFDAAKPTVAIIDWLAFTLRPPVGKTVMWVLEELQSFVGELCCIPRATGLYGYKESLVLEEAGLVAWGGKNQGGTVYVSLNGQGCARISDWSFVHQWCDQNNVRITRLDIAHDDFEGRPVLAIHRPFLVGVILEEVVYDRGQ